jgi:uncharacterized protein YhhL (DUF1145 family)
MIFFAKALCILAYAMALAGLAGVLPENVALWSLRVSLVLIAAHGLEVLVAFKYIKRYQGPLAVSVLLTMLFGLLHWRPLMDQTKA